MTKRQIELPTEAQWEYACRAGTTTRYFTGDKAESLDGSANVLDRSAKKQFPDWDDIIDFDDGYVFTSPVSKFRPNPFGLYDMIGNAREWCRDVYTDDFYATSDKKDPENSGAGTSRVLPPGRGTARRGSAAARTATAASRTTVSSTSASASLHRNERRR